MKKGFLILASVILLTACSSDTTQKDNQDKSDKEKEQTKQISTGMLISSDYYRTLLPFKVSAARGLTQDNMISSYNSEAFESGLLDISKQTFSPDDYLYRDGQFLDKDTVRAYLAPKYTKAEIKNMSDDEKEQNNARENLGLNPTHKGETDPEKIAENSPTYLSHIIEQDYFTESDAKKQKISGMTIGLAMNSEYVYQKEEYGETYTKKLDNKEVEKKGKEMAEEILSRLRVRDDLKNIPINFGIFIQSGEGDIKPGKFVSYASSEGGKRNVKSWEKMNQKYVTIPSNDAADLDENLNSNFEQFNQDLQKYFPNFTQSVGTGKFDDDKLTELEIKVPLDYYGKAEVIGVTQYVADLSQKYFKGIDDLEISIVDGEEPQALITKTKDDDEPQIHIYK
ncbi:CamS family sex pheromone protein [Mammaliicoccus sciuri]|uniref:CamS family sex pheromone protein n=1 Tax=Mammaliicoccus sciuri TaxID=1296 RepID=UPI002DB9FEA2|nr:CamS family sex pheromone protein [Mammaliicoccus sciuri]MEB5677876.1 CamS family sex pheromone protein [Mammaliicoccus sciuri]